MLKKKLIKKIGATLPLFMYQIVYQAVSWHKGGQWGGFLVAVKNTNATQMPPKCHPTAIQLPP